jgi:hypothetical protein
VVGSADRKGAGRRDCWYVRVACAGVFCVRVFYLRVAIYGERGEGKEWNPTAGAAILRRHGH